MAMGMWCFSGSHMSVLVVRMDRVVLLHTSQQRCEFNAGPKYHALWAFGSHVPRSFSWARAFCARRGNGCGVQIESAGNLFPSG